MAKINILSNIVCNRIAAGEVIDRPYSVVKELVENSLDAGATEVEIYIEKGGKDLIKIVDNGCGIEEDDMRSAFISHATSKITELEDIENINTFGFRGEALASVAAVAMVEMISVTQGNPAFKVECDGEFIGKVQPAVLEKGTQISVKNLFFNTPVRYKYLRTDKKEESDVQMVVMRMILGNPDVAFRYYVDGKLVLQSYGGGLEEAIAQVYGSNFLSQSIKIFADRNDIKISGYISNQNFFKANKTYQNIFLNGRHITNNAISSAVSNAYSHYAMKRQYPFYVLFVDVPNDIVDVNVHPNKSDVRFVNNSLIFGTVYKVISSVLDGTTGALEYVSNVDSKVDVIDEHVDNIMEKASVLPQTQIKSVAYAESINEEKVYDDNFDDVAGIDKFKKPEPPVVKNKFKLEDTRDLSVYEDYPEPTYFTEMDYKMFNERSEQQYMTVCSGHRDIFGVAELERKYKNRIDYETLKYRCTLFNTYLAYELKDEILLIDQHAAHERILFDKYMEEIRNRDVPRQTMLVSYLLDFNPKEREFFESKMRMIRNLGFSIEPFGMNGYRVIELPADLIDMDLKGFFAELVKDVNSLKAITVDDVFRERIAMTACKHAIKAGKQLTEKERDELMKKLDGDMGLKCPHGRPICVKINKKEIEKMFKRIV